MTIQCFYHADCMDGLAAAYLLRQNLPEIKLEDMIAVKYKEPMPEVKPGATLYIVDFSYSPEELLSACAIAKDVLLFDHHESAVKNLEAYFAINPVPANLHLTLDQTRSGVGLVHWSFSGDLPIQGIAKYIEDRDLWRFRYEETRPIFAACMMHGVTFEALEYLEKIGVEQAVAQGKLLIAKENQMIDWHIANSVQWGTFDGTDIPLVNAPRYITSELGGRLAETYPFVALYRDDANMREYSLRSRKDGGADVSLIAARFGGGGHKNAAGFRMELWQPCPFRNQ